MPTQTAGRGRPRKSVPAKEPTQSTTSSKKRKSTDDEASNPEPQKRSKKSFSHLKPRTRRVPQEIISTQWKRLQEPSQRQARDIFVRAKRTSLNGIRDARRRTEAESAVNAMVRRLDKQLPRMPFPPSAKAGHFNLDEIIVRNRALEAEELPAIHSIELLKSEIEREERRLEKRRVLLAELEAESDDDSRPQKDTTHPLLKKAVGTSKDNAEAIGLIPGSFKDSFFDSPDAELQPLITQLESHLDNIQANGAQLQGLGDALSSAHAALSVALPR